MIQVIDLRVIMGVDGFGLINWEEGQEPSPTGQDVP